jgi:hypothetical protein
MGRPEAERKQEDLVVWSYRFSRVMFHSGAVAGWENHSNNLKTRGPGDTRIAKDEPLSRSLEGGGSVPAGAIVHGAGGSSGSSSGSGFTNTDVIRVDGYTRQNGTRVEGHYRTQGNSSGTDNFSSRGNVNRYTGERGYR